MQLQTPMLTLLAAAVSALIAGHSVAAELSINPVLLDLVAPAAASVLTLRVSGEDATIQVRVMRWTEVGGKELLTPTGDVVASPPIVKVTPNADYVIRIVRVAPQPVVGEESYRVLVDQLPNLAHQSGQAVKILIRQSIPVFFQSPDLAPPKVSWSLVRQNGMAVLRATNAGYERLRIASLKLHDAAGTVSFGDGLNGYVLAHSSMDWVLPQAASRLGTNEPVTVSAVSDRGPVNATADPRASP